MDKQTYERYRLILERELIPATGCTEPIALAYAAALARDLLGSAPQSIDAFVSGSIIKNAKSVTVPNTGGLKGIEAAVAAGVVIGQADKLLEVLSAGGSGSRARIESFLLDCPIRVHLAQGDELFDILLEFSGGSSRSRVRITGSHTNVVLLEKDGCVQFEKQPADSAQENDTPPMDIAEILEFAQTCNLEDVRPVIERQIECNAALSQAGLTGEWGAQIGKTLLQTGRNDVLLRARARAAAASDARMGGCELPAVINSGSGNQGVTITLPVLEYAEAIGASHEQTVRALVLANLAAIRIKQEIGCLSAYCGAVCAGCAAGAGVAYLHAADRSLIEHTIVNGLAILSGTICDGAKPSCAAKIAMAVEAGILGFHMAQSGREFVHGEGIVKKGIENTIHEVGELGREGMAETNRVILNIMLKQQASR